MLHQLIVNNEVLQMKIWGLTWFNEQFIVSFFEKVTFESVNLWTFDIFWFIWGQSFLVLICEGAWHHYFEQSIVLVFLWHCIGSSQIHRLFFMLGLFDFYELSLPFNRQIKSSYLVPYCSPTLKFLWFIVVVSLEEMDF